MGALIPTFLAMLWRLRCCSHISNLIAKAFLLFFYYAAARKPPSPPAKASTTTVKPAQKRVTRSAAKGKANKSSDPVSSTNVADTSDAPSTSEARSVPLSADEIAASIHSLHDADDPDSEMQDGVDSGQLLHDTSLVQEATEIAEEQLVSIDKLKVTVSDRIAAAAILSNASALARKVNDSTTLKAIFELLVLADIKAGKLEGKKMALDRRVATRWNSDLQCLAAFIYFKVQIKKLIAEHSNLADLSLSEEQWELAEELESCLSVSSNQQSIRL